MSKKKLKGSKNMIDEDNKIVLKQPVKLEKSENYGAILVDAKGNKHYWLENGEYDGYDKIIE